MPIDSTNVQFSFNQGASSVIHARILIKIRAFSVKATKTFDAHNFNLSNV